MSDAPGPLSPHLQIYRWQITSVLSILHRASGLALFVAAPLYVFWLLGVALGEASFGAVQSVYGSWPGQLVLFGCTLAGMYHLLNGVRHLIWDTGIGFANAVVARGGYVVVGASIALTLVAWAIYGLSHG
jgi:succinate dehydrogenase / fumarate reductase, cytochrome b subunit